MPKAAFRCVALIGKHTAEIAESLGIPVGTVKSRLFRARRILQGSLRRYAEATGLIPPKTETP